MHRGIGSPSTWDLHRFELIAQEVLSYLPASGNGGDTAANDSASSSRQPTEGSHVGISPADSEAAAAAQPPASTDSQPPESEGSGAPQLQQSSSSGRDYGSAADLGSGFPFTLVGALNSVLYQRQGYKPMARHGTPQ